MLDRAQKHVVASSLAGLALLFFDQTAVIVALPAIAQDFGSTAFATQWTVTAHLLALAVFMPLVGRVADRYRRKSVLLTGLVCFGIGSTACAAAPNLLVLVGCRFVQGIGAAVMQPLALAAGTRNAPADRRGWLIGLMTTGGTSFLILGPLIAAGLLSMVSLVNYLERAMGETTVVAGLVVAAAGIFTPILSTVTGRRADRNGARPLVLRGLVLGDGGAGGGGHRRGRG